MSNLERQHDDAQILQLDPSHCPAGDIGVERQGPLTPSAAAFLHWPADALNAGRATVIAAELLQLRNRRAAERECHPCHGLRAVHGAERGNSPSAGDAVMVPQASVRGIFQFQYSVKQSRSWGLGGQRGIQDYSWRTGHSLLEIDPGSKTGKMDISGFWFVGGDPDYWSGTAISFGGPKGWKNLRIHHNVFEDNIQWTIVGYAGTHGVIDHNTFKGYAHGIVFYGDGAEDWATSLTLGTADFIFVEDNVFDWDDWYGATGAALWTCREAAE